jgi:hemerythrin superfamily protein
MSVQLEDNKRTAIAEKLAEMRAFQNLLIANEQILVEACPDSEITNRFEDMLRDDRKNLGIIDSVIVQYGIKAETKPRVQQAIEEAEQMMQNSELSLFEKVAKHELLTHTQAMSGVLVHKAAQVVGADIAVAIAPLNAVNFENRGHEEQLKGIMESLSTLELTGKPSDHGLWSRVQDTIAALSGIAGSVTSRRDDEMSICDVIRLDHTKVNALFAQIKTTDEPQKLEEIFGQIYQDLSTHSEAEEQVVYPALKPYYQDIQKLYDEQAEMKKMLDLIKAADADETEKFKAAIELLRQAVTAHVEEEERDMFPLIQGSFGDEQRKHLAAEFKSAKSQIQDRRLATVSN